MMKIPLNFNHRGGMHDVLPEDHDYFTVIKSSSSSLSSSGFRRISTPVMEDSGVFERSIGQQQMLLRKKCIVSRQEKIHTLFVQKERLVFVERI